jgi:hypothetical protein
MFCDVTFTSSADITQHQLYKQLKLCMTAKPDYLLPRIPTKKQFTATVTGGTFSHVIAIDNNRFLTVHDPAIAIIWKVTETELIREHEIQLAEEDTSFAWESTIDNNLAYILLSRQISVLDLNRGKQLAPIILQEEDVNRYSHNNMLKTTKNFIIANDLPKMNCYSLNGELTQQVPEQDLGRQNVLSVFGISDEKIAFGTNDRFYIYNMRSKEFEFEHIEQQNVLSIQYFPEYGIIVYGTAKGHTVLFDINKNQVVDRYVSEFTWNTVVRVGKTWVACVYFGKCVEIFDIVTRKRIHMYDVPAMLSVAAVRNRLVMLTDYEVSVWA